MNFFLTGEENPVFTPGGWHDKIRVLEGLCLCDAFNIELAPRNVFSEFVIIYTAIGCECNCYYLCRFLGKTEVSILSESRQLPP